MHRTSRSKHFASTPPDRRHGLPDFSIARAGAALLVFGAFAAACSDATSAKLSASQLGFTTKTATGASASIAPITGGGHTLDLTSATLTISRAEVKPAAGATCTDDAADDDRGPGGGDNDTTKVSDDCDEMKVGPVSIDLPLDGSVVTIPADEIPA